MKVITEDGRVYLCVEHDMGRLERVFASEPNVSPELLEHYSALAKRVCSCINACASMSDASLQALPANVIAERLMAWELIVSRSHGTASTVMQRARAVIEKRGGKL